MSEDIRIRRGEPDGPLCNHFRDTLIRHVFSLPESKDLKGPPMGDSSRPMTLPEGALFLYAETGAEDKPEPAGSICLIPLRRGSPNFEGLPAELGRLLRGRLESPAPGRRLQLHHGASPTLSQQLHLQLHGLRPTRGKRDRRTCFLHHGL